MSLKVEEKENDIGFSILEKGVYPARIVHVIDIGEQESEFKGEVKINPKVLYTFELTDEKIIIDGEELPRFLSKEYTVPNTEFGWKKSNLSQIMSAAGKVDNLTKHAGKPVMVTVGVYTGKDGKNKNKVESVSGVPKGMKVSPLYHDPIVYEFGEKIPEGLQDWIKEKIKNSLSNNRAIELEEDDMPF